MLRKKLAVARKGGRIEVNKHKFVQKVAKKIILLIPFVLSVSIRVVHEN